MYDVYVRMCMNDLHIYKAFILVLERKDELKIKFLCVTTYCGIYYLYSPGLRLDIVCAKTTIIYIAPSRECPYHSSKNMTNHATNQKT